MVDGDLISDIFKILRVSGEVYFRARLAGPICVEIPQSYRHIRFHIVLSGQCWLCLNDAEPLLMQKGDIVLVPEGQAQEISTEPDLASHPLMDAIAGGALKDGQLSLGSGVQRAQLLCGFLQFDEQIEHPILSLLPSHMHLSDKTLSADPWLQSALHLISLEARHPGQGMAAIVTRLIEVIFIQAIRQRIELANDTSEGFLLALSDRSISRVLSAMHDTPDQKWSVEGLADIAGQSRSAFARKFAEQVGTSPMDYLRRWRLSKARLLLVSSQLSMGEIAFQCGYDCVPSFSRSFKREFHIGPGTFRKNGGSSTVPR
ncbi:AraC family transcriptional regulator [Cohaesibacter sp. CAU 1516]|uniref:AraC family transcriptional regulator n=1 Tax=Cohaesibacter sp. CAU 1516 TaxID=2576038 RepID=UPI0010FEF46B|nr:AraC family transcriptional regulator [Cohaesibacter sp. CAU 1516]TLP47229.1 AraC family transcriptional regulator [Cohaesibacter sp. CAU 1516]